MHRFTELVRRSTEFTLGRLSEANERTLEALQTSGATTLVKALQMIQLQKAIFAIGMFSIFEAQLQDSLGCADGFERARDILNDAGESELRDRFEHLFLAVNVLKHGRGRSYDKLVASAQSLPFRVKLSDEVFLEEGDVAEISTLVEVDDAFVELCGSVVAEVAKVIEQRTGIAL